MCILDGVNSQLYTQQFYPVKYRKEPILLHYFPKATVVGLDIFILESNDNFGGRL